jgi:hypothetical protein
MLIDFSSAIATSKQLQDPFADGLDVVRAGSARRLGVVLRESLVDLVMRFDRCMRACVRLEPRLARCAEHVPDHAEHRREELVARRVADDLVEARVLVGVGLPGGDLPFLRAEQLAELGELGCRDVRRRERGDRRLDDTAEFDDVRQRVTASDERLKRPREIVGRDLADERAATGTRLDDPQELEGAECFADRRARDLELIRERALSGKLVAGAELSSFKEGLDLLDDALIELDPPDWLDSGQ